MASKNSPSSATSDPKPESRQTRDEPSFVDIHDLQTKVIVQAETVLDGFVSRVTDEKETISVEGASLLQIRELFRNMKDIFNLFQSKAMDEIQQLSNALKESKAREVEWKELADLFQQYRVKVTSEMNSMKSIIDVSVSSKEAMQEQLRQKEGEVQSMQLELLNLQDLLLRVQATQHRRAKLISIQKEIDAEDAAISATVARLAAAASQSSELPSDK